MRYWLKIAFRAIIRVGACTAAGAVIAGAIGLRLYMNPEDVTALSNKGDTQAMAVSLFVLAVSLAGAVVGFLVGGVWAFSLVEHKEDVAVE